MSNDDKLYTVQQMLQDTLEASGHRSLSDMHAKVTELEVAHLRNITGNVFGPVSGSDSVEDTLEGYADFIRSRLTPLP